LWKKEDCRLGYSDFDFLRERRILAQRWMQILGYICKIYFSFLSRFESKFEKRAKKTQFLFYKKFSSSIKNKEFDADLESAEKVS
jgi:hypothetical protein